MSATLDITDVFASAVKVKVQDVEPGDSVFDPMGRTWPVRKVTVFKHTVRLRRFDLDYPESFEYDSTITIVRGDQS